MSVGWINYYELNDKIRYLNYPLSKVAEAFRYFEEGHYKGKVVITIKHNNNI
jgi:hypothetical protein